LPFCRIKLVGRKPERKSQIDPKTFGDHLRKRRLDLHLTLREVAKQVRCDPSSVNAWELNYHQPALHLYPAVVAFLGYDPAAVTNSDGLGQQVAIRRRALGFSQRVLAERLGIDEGTLSRWEAANLQRVSRRVRGLFMRWLSRQR
jgi:transcriptional regulator with XRE-family HTH domain